MLDVFSILESRKAFPRMSQNPETTKGKTNKELHKNKKYLQKKKKKNTHCKQNHNFSKKDREKSTISNNKG